MTAYEPSFISDWITAKAQDDHKVEFYVPFTDIENANETQVPVKVIVEVKVEDGDDYYIFNAFGSSPRDDDATEKYGGVIYLYNASGVLILLPEKFDNDPFNMKNDNGLAVYLGTDTTWYQPLSLNGGTIKTEYSDASVRVKMWRQNDMPPDYDTDFQYHLRSKNDISKNNLTTYFEIPIGMTSYPDMVVVQAKPTATFAEFPGVISEGNGIPGCFTCGREAGGLTFAYNASHVRVWVKKNYPITSAADGWGLKTYLNNERLVSYEVNIRVLAWNFDSDTNKCRWTMNSTIYANQQSTEVPRMIFSSPIEDMNSVLVLVSVSMLLI
nr:uncharacterized protein LOC105337774 [Crassostrea gigas]